MFEEALAAFRKDWVVLALAYQEKQNQSEGVEGNLGPFWLISWSPISPDWTPQSGGLQYTCHPPPIIAFSLCLSPSQFPFLHCQILWQKRFELWWLSLLQLLPRHTTSWSQQCLYSRPVASCCEILLFSGRAGLCPHTCTHPHTLSLTVHHVLYWTALHAAGPLSPDAHLSISKSSLGLLGPMFLQTSFITLPRLSSACGFMRLPSLPSLWFTPLLLLLPIFSSSHLSNCQTELPPCAKVLRTYKWINDGLCLPGDNQSCSEKTYLRKLIWKASSTEHDLCA